MTENEAIEWQKAFKRTYRDIPSKSTSSNAHEACDMAIEALLEIQRYRAIGTAAECREAREKQIPKTPCIWGDGYSEGKMIYDMYDCPGCGRSYEIDYEKHDYCPNCGQAIDFGGIEDE